jgi:hypothetical protein
LEFDCLSCHRFHELLQLNAVGMLYGRRRLLSLHSFASDRLRSWESVGWVRRVHQFCTLSTVSRVYLVLDNDFVGYVIKCTFLYDLVSVWNGPG